MPRFEDGCYGSLKGIALIAKVLAGRCKMHYTRVAAGKGTLPEDLTPKTLMEPPEYVMDAMISSVTNPVDGECQVSVQINSVHVENGFYCTWLILYAEDPDEGEVPFTALCLESEPEWIRPSSSIVGKLAHFDIIAAVGDVDNVSATIDPDALVTLESVQQLITEHSRDTETHQDIRQAVKALQDKLGGGVVRAELAVLAIPAAGWAESAGAYPFYVDVPHGRITEDAVPLLTILPASLGAAEECRLCPAAEAMPGALRVWAKSVPTADIAASLLLLRDVRASEEIAIPAVGWVDDEDTAGEYPLHMDIAIDAVTEDLAPLLTILPDSMPGAALCGVSPTARTLDGFLRVYAKCAPDKPIRARLALLGTGSAGRPGGYAIPAATADTLGGVRVRQGSGLTIDGEGSLAIDAAGKNDAAALFDSDAGNGVE